MFNQADFQVGWEPGWGFNQRWVRWRVYQGEIILTYMLLYKVFHVEETYLYVYVYKQ